MRTVKMHYHRITVRAVLSCKRRAYDWALYNKAPAEFRALSSRGLEATEKLRRFELSCLCLERWVDGR